MAWIYLFIAGALEIAWAAALKTLGVRFDWAWALLAVFAMIGSLVALYAAMIRLPLGVAYPIWTGIGSVGTVVAGVLAFNQTLTPSTVAGLACLLLGMFLIGANAH